MGYASKGKGLVMILCRERILRTAKLGARGLLLMTLSCCLHFLSVPTHILIPVQRWENSQTITIKTCSNIKRNYTSRLPVAM
ncbi:hypothetical protein I79_018583 [Cricetulus griseus]|uniref:Uncharacterized protein n=1 Tax=Cricetulus griseus TaxID=10029 RepID=G3I546_CRIGR|nr:hypothetical protein I79_018583 [Cricetulus griseus]